MFPGESMPQRARTVAGAEVFLWQDSVCGCRSSSPAAFRQEGISAKANKSPVHKLNFPLPEGQCNEAAAIPRQPEST